MKADSPFGGMIRQSTFSMRAKAAAVRANGEKILQGRRLPRARWSLRHVVQDESARIFHRESVDKRPEADPRTIPSTVMTPFVHDVPGPLDPSFLPTGALDSSRIKTGDGKQTIQLFIDVTL
jgi:hypothetical protein